MYLEIDSEGERKSPEKFEKIIICHFIKITYVEKIQIGQLSTGKFLCVFPLGN